MGQFIVEYFCHFMLYQQKTYTLLLINDNRNVIERIVNYYYTDISQASQIKAKVKIKLTIIIFKSTSKLYIKKYYIYIIILMKQHYNILTALIPEKKIIHFVKCP